jgi:SOS response regulatory protein OraA/RecX
MIYDGLNWAGKQISNAIMEQLRNVYESMLQVERQISNVFSNVQASINNFVHTFSQTLDQVSRTITRSFDDILSRKTQVIAEELRLGRIPQEEFMNYIWQMINFVARAGATPPLIPALVLNEFLSSIVPSIPDPEIRKKLGAYADLLDGFLNLKFDKVARAWNTLAIDLYDLIYGTFNPEEPPTFEQAKKVCMDLFLTNLSLNVAVTAVEVVDSIVSLGVLKDILRGFLRDFYWTSGLAWVAWVTLSSVLRHRVTEPFDRWFLETYRTEYPSMGMLEDMLQYGQMTEEEWRKWMAKRGYPDDVIQKFLVTLRQKWKKDVTKELLSQLYQNDIIDEDTFRKELSELNYSPDVINYIIQLEKRKKETKGKGAEREASYQMWSSWFRAGLISESEFREALKDLGYSPEVINLIVSYEKWRLKQSLQEPEKDATRSLLERFYKEDLINDSQFIAWMRELGYKDEVIQLDLQYLKKIKSEGEKTETRDATRSMLEAWFRTGIIDESEFYEYLKRLGYPDDIVRKIILYNKIKMRSQPEERKKLLTVSQITEAYQRGVISREEAVKRFLDLGYSPEDASILAAIYLVTQTPETKELTRSLLEKAFTKGLIDEVGFRERLISMGYSEADANLIITLTKLRIKVEPEEVGIKKLTATQILNSMSRWIITPSDAKRMLMDLGYDEKTTEILMANEFYEWMKNEGVHKYIIELLMENPNRVPKAYDILREIKKHRDIEKAFQEMSKRGFSDELISFIRKVVLEEYG